LIDTSIKLGVPYFLRKELATLKMEKGNDIAEYIRNITFDTS
jgi:hypothetical protein